MELIVERAALARDPEYLRTRFEYEKETGVLKWRFAWSHFFKSERAWKSWNTRLAGRLAGAKHANGYLYVNLNQKVMLVHRIIWAMETGVWPTQIDHVNHIRSDNRWSNLRDVTNAINAKNIGLPADNTSGRIGVYWFKDREKWYAKIKVNGHNKHLGYFDQFEEAVAAREAAEREFGFHKNHGLADNDNSPLRGREPVSSAVA